MCWQSVVDDLIFCSQPHNSQLASGLLQLSVLEEKAIAPRVRLQCHRPVMDFLAFREVEYLTLKSPEEADAAIVKSLVDLFLMGLDMALGQELAAAWAAFFPSFSRHGLAVTRWCEHVACFEAGAVWPRDGLAFE